jgi:hypothetical protein
MSAFAQSELGSAPRWMPAAITLIAHADSALFLDLRSFHWQRVRKCDPAGGISKRINP